MADLAAFPFLAPHSLRRPPVGGLPVVAGLVPNPMSWGGGGDGRVGGLGGGGWEGGSGGEGGHSLGTGVGHHRSTEIKMFEIGDETQ